jgi:heptosyltransferase-2
VLGVRLPNWLGDALLSRRALDSLVARYGEEQLVLAARQNQVALLRTNYPRARWLVTDHGFSAAWRLGRQWKSCGVEEVWLFPTSLSSRISGRRSGARSRVGFGSRPGRRAEFEANALLTRRVPRGSLGSRHLEDEYLDLVGAEPANLPPRRGLRLPPTSRSSGRELLAGTAHRPYVVIAPGARYGPAKRWPPERFARTAGRVAADLELGDLVIVGEAADGPSCQAVEGHLQCTVVQLAGRTDLGALAEVLSGAAGVIANDSGTAHLAAALGRPTVVIFGSTEPAWTAPRGERVAIRRERVRCSPCFRRRCPLADANACLRLIEPDAVARSLVRLVRSEAA